jgi:hypothetical protein
MSPMNREVLDFQVNNRICEAVRCSAKATNEIEVKVGSHGAISLLLCDNCISKFQENNVYHYKNQARDLNRIEAK